MGKESGPEAGSNRSPKLPDVAAGIGAQETARPQNPITGKRRAFYDHLRSESSTGESIKAAFAELRVAVVESNLDDLTALLQLRSDARTGLSASRGCGFKDAADFFEGT